MHLIVTALVVLFTIVSLKLFAIGFLRTKEHKWLGVISLVTLLLLMIGAMLINLLPKEYFGVAERVNVYSIVMFTGVLAFWMKRYVKDKDVL
jgi:ABC-type multidrug transport system permease subunit